MKKEEEEEKEEDERRGEGGKKDGNKSKTRIMVTTCPVKACLCSRSES